MACSFTMRPKLLKYSFRFQVQAGCQRTLKLPLLLKELARKEPNNEELICKWIWIKYKNSFTLKHLKHLHSLLAETTNAVSAPLVYSGKETQQTQQVKRSKKACSTKENIFRSCFLLILQLFMLIDLSLSLSLNSLLPSM